MFAFLTDNVLNSDITLFNFPIRKAPGHLGQKMFDNPHVVTFLSLFGGTAMVVTEVEIMCLFDDI